MHMCALQANGVSLGAGAALGALGGGRLLLFLGLCEEVHVDAQQLEVQEAVRVELVNELADQRCDNLISAKALYMKWLRNILTQGVLKLGQRSSPRKKKKTVTNLMADLDDDDEPADPAAAEQDHAMQEVAAWKNLPVERVKQFADDSGLINEFKLAYAVREELPLHYTLAKQVHSHLAHEANAEETFSLSGRLSDPNARGDPGFLERRTRINKNRSVHDPSQEAVLKAYKAKYRKLPELGDDVTDDEGEEGDDGCDADDEFGYWNGDFDW